MRNRALIARWVMDNSDGVASLIRHDGKTFLHISDYAALRQLFARLLAEIQRIKSEGDYAAARDIVERYGVTVDTDLQREVHDRYSKLDIAPYKGFINPRLSVVEDANGKVVDINADYTETYEHQMLRYSSEYGFL